MKERTGAGTPGACSTAPQGTQSASSLADIVGEGFVAELTSPMGDGIPHSFLTKEDLRRLQSDIANTIRPSHSTGPPAKIGTKAQGKLKADQWKAAIEFELPVYLMRYWLASDATVLDEAEAAKHDVAVITMRLACAIRQGISYRISEQHKDAYGAHMLAYLAGIQRVRPDRSLLPSHHSAMHIPSFLIRFGPMPGWWMFPFERVIGLLQQISTNGKIGESHSLYDRAKVCSPRLARPNGANYA